MKIYTLNILKMTKKVINKQVTVTANLTGLTDADFSSKTGGYGQAVTENILLLPTITPAGTVVTTKVGLLNTMFLDRDDIIKLLKAKTAEIAAAKAELNNIVVVQWVPQIQEACGGDPEKIKLIGFGIKGIDDGKAAVVVGMASGSHPIINYVDTKVHLQHTVSIINSLTGGRAVAKGASRTEVYMQIGGTVPPNDISKMSHVGAAKKGFRKVNFDISNLGNTVYYIAVYIDKKTGDPLEMSPVYSAFIS